MTHNCILPAILVAVGLFVLPVNPAIAQDNDGARFSLQPSGDGFVRLDRKTGEMSFCALREDQLVCRLAADERKAYDSEVARLEQRLEALESGRDDLETKPKTSDRLPAVPEVDEREFEKAMDYMERALRRFFDVVQNLRGEFESKRDAY